MYWIISKENNFVKIVYIMYKDKYYKYKTKYLEWLKDQKEGSGSLDPDKGDGKDEDILESVPDSELEFDSEEEQEFNKDLEEKVNNRQNFEGFDADPGADFITDDLQQDTFDIGMYGKARGKTFEFDDFDNNEFVRLGRPNKLKILMINNKNSFDDFTEKYGCINKKDNKLYIEWNKVNKHYKGIYITSAALSDRDDTIPFMGRTKENWIDYDFNHLDDVVIFKKYRNLVHSRKISRPFKGHAVDNYSVEETEFSRITDPITNDKILLIDDIKSFDKFTRTYGIVTPSKTSNPFISIKWNQVKKDYDGIYIDKDNDFEKDRFAKAYLNNKIYDSWWEKSNVEAGVVYLFR